MSVRKDGKIIAGTTVNPDLFDWKWADHILDNVSWLRADTFSWQAGSVYQAAYAHLVLDVDDKTLQSETVAGTTIQFYLADDGHKVCPASEESNVTAIYNATGVAWYYIIDTTNQRFKLPRTKFGITGLRDKVGNYVAPGAPNITAVFGTDGQYSKASGAVSVATNGSNAHGWNGSGQTQFDFTFDASRSSSIYGASNTIQPPATQQYLYFYVGNFTPTALQNTAGLNAELFNGKLDQDFSNATADIASSLNNVGARTIVETYASGNDWYRKYSDGWVEQGSNAHNRGSSATWNFLVPMLGTYNAQITARGSQRYAWVTDMQLGYLKFSAADDSSQNNDGLYYIKVCGYAAS